MYIGTLATAAGFVIASRRWELGVLFYLRNQEYQALIGFLIGVAVLIWKCW